jgi:hypothetical protein
MFIFAYLCLSLPKADGELLTPSFPAGMIGIAEGDDHG